MKYTLWFKSERFTFLNQSLFNIKVLTMKDGYVEFEITIDSEFDLLNLFHAGRDYGMDVVFQSNRRATA